MKRLYRSRSDRLLAGVCGGIAQYFADDPTLVRLAFVAFNLAGGSGVLAYLILALVVPREPLGEAPGSTPPVEPGAPTSAQGDPALGSSARDTALGSNARDAALGSNARDTALGSNAQDTPRPEQ